MNSNVQVNINLRVSFLGHDITVPNGLLKTTRSPQQLDLFKRIPREIYIYVEWKVDYVLNLDKGYLYIKFHLNQFSN